MKKNDNRCVNRHETLNNEDEENDDDNVDDDMSDDSSEVNINDISFEDDEEMEDVNSCGNLEHSKSEYVRGPTREIMYNEIKTLEQVVDIKSETIQMLKVKIEEKEAKINNIRIRTKNMVDTSLVTCDRALLGKKIQACCIICKIRKVNMRQQ